MKVTGRQGFTLIELLIVVVIIGILAAIAIPKFSATREKAYVSAMKADLRNLSTAQDLYYSDPANNYSYAASVDALTDYSPSEGVTVTTSGDQDGWSATAEHAALGSIPAPHCAVFHGDAAPVAPATTPGVIACVSL